MKVVKPLKSVSTELADSRLECESSIRTRPLFLPGMVLGSLPWVYQLGRELWTADVSLSCPCISVKILVNPVSMKISSAAFMLNEQHIPMSVGRIINNLVITTSVVRQSATKLKPISFIFLVRAKKWFAYSSLTFSHLTLLRDLLRGVDDGFTIIKLVNWMFLLVYI